MTDYREIVFLDGDEGSDLSDMIENVEGVAAYGPTTESLAEAVRILSQWDYGDSGEVRDAPPWGSADKTHEAGEYVLSWNLGLGYVSLTAVDA